MTYFYIDAFKWQFVHSYLKFQTFFALLFRNLFFYVFKYVVKYSESVDVPYRYKYEHNQQKG